MEPKANSILRLRRLIIVGVLLIAAWMPLILPFPGASILLMVAITASICLPIRWRSRLPLILLIVNPLTIGLCVGMHEWFSKRPQFSYMGLPGPEAFNLDPATRCYRATGGCVVTGDEWIYQLPHNAGLYVMAKLFGPPKCVYQGPYPTKEQAIQLTKFASETAPELFRQGKVLVDGKEISLGKDKTDKLLGDFSMTFFGIDDSSSHIAAQIFQEHCLVVRVGTKMTNQDGSVLGQSKGIVLFEKENLRPFARYVVTGHYARVPRLLVE